jgi:hypothetical protein
MKPKKPNRRVNRKPAPPDGPATPESVPLVGEAGTAFAEVPVSATGPGTSTEPTRADAVAPGPAPDPFDLERLRNSQDFAADVGVRRLLNIPVRKPDKSWWFRTHPDPAYRPRVGLLELKEELETYWVVPELWPLFATEPTFAFYLLVTAINRKGVVFLWPIKLPGPDGKVLEWHRTAMEAVDAGRSYWTRMYADMSLRAYRVEVAEALQIEPTWPTLRMRDLLEAAFRDKVIATLDHPVPRHLRGET